MTKMRIYFLQSKLLQRDGRGRLGKKVLIIATAIVYSVGNSHNFVLPAVSTNRMMYLPTRMTIKRNVSVSTLFFSVTLQTSSRSKTEPGARDVARLFWRGMLLKIHIIYRRICCSTKVASYEKNACVEFHLMLKKNNSGKIKVYWCPSSGESNTSSHS